MKKKHKITLLIIGIFLSLSLMLWLSYAYYIFNVSQSGSNVVRTDCFEITFEDGDAISLSNTIPLTDKEAKELTPYTFTIKNICNNAVDYYVNVETLNTSTMDLNAVAIKLDGKKKQILGTLENNETIINSNATSSKTIYSNILKAGEEKTHNIRMWIDIDATMEQSESKSFSSKIVVSGVLHPNYSEAILIAGQNFNKELKKLADGGNPGAYVANTSITSIEWSDTAPQESDNAINVADSSSDKLVYAWFKEGTIYINSEADKIYMHPHSQDMFNNMKNVESVELRCFDTTKVTNMKSMFSGMESIVDIDLSNFDTSNVTDMGYMFSNAKGITSLDLSNFDTTKVTDMSAMFQSMSNLVSVNLNSFDTSNVTNMSYMFTLDSNLASLYINSFNTAKVTNMSRMFNKVTSLTNLDLSNFNTSNVTDMSYMFTGMSGLTDLDLSSFDTLNVTNMRNMFNGLSNLTSLNVSSFNTSNVTNMYCMFDGVSSITSLDLSGFDTSKVTSMDYMFSNNQKLKIIYISDNWNTSSVTNSSYMFKNCSNLIGGAGTTYDSNHVDAEYARIDDPDNGKPGYLTLKTS